MAQVGDASAVVPIIWVCWLVKSGGHPGAAYLHGGDGGVSPAEVFGPGSKGQGNRPPGRFRGGWAGGLVGW